MPKNFKSTLIFIFCICIVLFFSVSISYINYIQKEEKKQQDFQRSCSNFKNQCSTQIQQIRNSTLRINTKIVNIEHLYRITTNSMAYIELRWGNYPNLKVQGVLEDARVRCATLERKIIDAKNSRNYLIQVAEEQIKELDRLIRTDIKDPETLKSLSQIWLKLQACDKKIDSSYGEYGYYNGQIDTCYLTVKTYCNIDKTVNISIDRILNYKGECDGERGLIKD